jgi:hypothetical protein
MSLLFLQYACPLQVFILEPNVVFYTTDGHMEEVVVSSAEKENARKDSKDVKIKEKSAKDFKGLETKEKARKDSKGLETKKKVGNEMKEKAGKDSKDMEMKEKIGKESKDVEMKEKAAKKSKDAEVKEKPGKDSKDVKMKEKVGKESKDAHVKEKAGKDSKDLEMQGKAGKESKVVEKLDDHTLSNKEESDSETLVSAFCVPNLTSVLILLIFRFKILTNLLHVECAERLEKTYSESNIVLLSQLTFHIRMQISQAGSRSRMWIFH